MAHSSKGFVIRAVSFADYPSLRQLALKHPLLNLPAEEKLLKEKIEISQNSFNETLPKEKRNFLFVLKTVDGIDPTKSPSTNKAFSSVTTDPAPLLIRRVTSNLGTQPPSTNRAPSSVLPRPGGDSVIGSSQVSAKSGTIAIPSYSLKMDKKEQGSFLCLKKITDGPSYLGGLILQEDYRGHPEKLGKQISLIRFLFAGIYPHFFEDTFHAEVAPFLNKEGENPFFENFIKKHISLSMQEIDYLTLTNKEQLFANYPKNPIALSDLPDQVQQSLGKPGLFSQRASALLTKQNFCFSGEVDPFDGGPYMQAKAKSIPIIQSIKKVSLYPKAEPASKAEPAPTAEPVRQTTTPPYDREQKWLFALPDKNNFKGGVLKGTLKNQNLFISPCYFTLFQLKSPTTVFIAPFSDR